MFMADGECFHRKRAKWILMIMIRWGWAKGLDLQCHVIMLLWIRLIIHWSLLNYGIKMNRQKGVLFWTIKCCVQSAPKRQSESGCLKCNITANCKTFENAVIIHLLTDQIKFFIVSSKCRVIVILLFAVLNDLSHSGHKQVITFIIVFTINSKWKWMLFKCMYVTLNIPIWKVNYYITIWKAPYGFVKGDTFLTMTIIDLVFKLIIRFAGKWLI